MSGLSAKVTLPGSLAKNPPCALHIDILPLQIMLLRTRILQHNADDHETAYSFISLQQCNGHQVIGPLYSLANQFQGLVEPPGIKACTSINKIFPFRAWRKCTKDMQQRSRRGQPQMASLAAHPLFGLKSQI